MEDRHVIIGRLGGSSATLYGVFDGHGGSNAAQFCADNIREKLTSAADFPEIDAKPRDVLREAILALDKRYLQIANEQHLDDGTTLIVALVTGKKITVANVGDSRAVLVKASGRGVSLSVDHKPNHPKEKERITRLGGTIMLWGVWRVEGVLAVSRAIGDRMLKAYVSGDPEFMQVDVSPEDDYLVVASDGLWDVISNSELGKILHGNGRRLDAQQASDLLAAEALAKGSQDNVCVVVVDLAGQTAGRTVQKS